MKKRNKLTDCLQERCPLPITNNFCVQKIKAIWLTKTLTNIKCHIIPSLWTELLRQAIENNVSRETQTYADIETGKLAGKSPVPLFFNILVSNGISDCVYEEIWFV